MSKLHELKSKIESIPEKRRRKNIVGKLALYERMAQDAYATLVQVTRSQSYVMTVFPEGDFQRVAEQKRKAASSARRLHRRLADNMDAIDTQTSNTQFIALGDHAKSSQTALKDRWVQLLNRKIIDFENLVRAASGANLGGSRTLVETLERLRGQASAPPKSLEVAQRTARDIRGLEESVKTLGLTGRPGDFLIAAAAGHGNPRDLSDPEISEFIERYNLWGLLTVKLG